MNALSCHVCGAEFTAVRRDAQFCGSACRKTSSRLDVPNDTQRRDPSEERRVIERFDLNNVLVENYKRLDPSGRPAYIEWLIDRAIAGDTKIAEVLSNHYLLGSGAERNLRVHQPTISKLAHEFTRGTWGVRIKDAVNTLEGGKFYSTVEEYPAAA